MTKINEVSHYMCRIGFGITKVNECRHYLNRIGSDNDDSNKDPVITWHDQVIQDGGEESESGWIPSNRSVKATST